MAAQTISETAQKIMTNETLRNAAKQSQRCLVVPVRLRRAIKKYLKGVLSFFFFIFVLGIYNFRLMSLQSLMVDLGL